MIFRLRIGVRMIEAERKRDALVQQKIRLSERHGFRK